MSDLAQRVLDALIEYDTNEGIGYPIMSIHQYFDNGKIDEDYEALTADEEKQIIKAFLESAY